MTLKMCDLAWSKPAPAALAAAGIQAACLYVGQDASGKNMTAGYVQALAAVGIATVTNFEYYANQMLSGASQGAADAALGLSQARACGMPAGRPIYYSADFAATGAQITGPLTAYLEAARSVTGAGTVGVYGSDAVVTGLLAHWAAVHPAEHLFTWQTAAWSAGVWAGSDDARQPGTQITVGGFVIDVDYADVADFGQWTPGQAGQGPASAGTPTAVPVGLVLGATGPAVVALQLQLANQGFPPGRADGVFGVHTDTAVRNLQAARHISVDGDAGPVTTGQLTAPPPGGYPQVGQGAKGGVVARVQGLLVARGYSPGSIDGDFGPNTASAVVAAQRAAGIAQDGIVGPVTWSHLRP